MVSNFESTADYKKNYEEYGYVVFNKLIPEYKISNKTVAIDDIRQKPY
jgi:hypothetical protein